MINLLPPSEKQNLLDEEKGKLILILGLTLAIFLVAIIMIFFAVNVVISSEVKSQKTLLEQKSAEFNETEIKIFQDEIAAANKTLYDLNYFYKEETDFVSFLQEISSLLPSGVFLKNISINSIDKTESRFQISLSGFAPTVENMAELQENLKVEKNFSQVYIPPSIWVKQRDIEFDISFQAVIKK
ncbi:MAG: PilN domain-containing protein [Patescibacteria group bacterium]